MDDEFDIDSDEDFVYDKVFVGVDDDVYDTIDEDVDDGVNDNND